MLNVVATYLYAKGETDTTIILTPSEGVLVRIGPEQIAQQTLIGHVCGPHDTSDLLHGCQVWTQTAVTTENLFINCVIEIKCII